MLGHIPNEILDYGTHQHINNLSFGNGDYLNTPYITKNTEYTSSAVVN